MIKDWKQRISSLVDILQPESIYHGQFLFLIRKWWEGTEHYSFTYRGIYMFGIYYLITLVTSLTGKVSEEGNKNVFTETTSSFIYILINMHIAMFKVQLTVLWLYQLIRHKLTNNYLSNNLCLNYLIHAWLVNKTAKQSMYMTGSHLLIENYGEREFLKNSGCSCL